MNNTDLINQRQRLLITGIKRLCLIATAASAMLFFWRPIEVWGFVRLVIIISGVSVLSLLVFKNRFESPHGKLVYPLFGACVSIIVFLHRMGYLELESIAYSGFIIASLLIALISALAIMINIRLSES